ncbi:MAG: cyclic dehypoxanthinyl futalosine synthase [Armatimonadota bacterium]|nr:dehypoxanthine futalosine cyclase [bacterium]
MSVRDILTAATEGVRISASDAVELFDNAKLTELSWVAGQVCNRKHSERIRTYVIDRNINYTNICMSGCKFCAFFRSPGHPEGYVLSNAEILHKIEEAVELGATQILMQGGLHPELKIDYFEELFGEIKKRFQIQLHSLSAPEIVHISRVSGLGIDETLARLHYSGLDSLPGGGAEILMDNVRSRVSPEKCRAYEWLDVMRAAGSIGMRATATMVFGMGESYSERVGHLSEIRNLQDETDVFTAFIPWPFQPGNTALGGRAAGGHDYLRTLAISRLFLDNVDNMQASWVTQGSAIAQLSLVSGANDIGSTMIEENVVAAAGVCHRMNESELIDLIHGAGYDAVQRDTLYGIIKTIKR